MRVRSLAGCVIVGLLLAVASCSPTTDPALDALAHPQAVLADAGRRLSASFSADELTKIARHEPSVLAHLNGAERFALARGELKFVVDRPVDVFVAFPRGHDPFWLGDLGFQKTALSMNDGTLTWDLHARLFGPGPVRLGVNALDRKAPAHYAVFVRAGEGGNATLAVSGDGWESVPATRLAALEREGPGGVTVLPEPLIGSTLIRQARDRRHASLLARGKVWKTHVASSSHPDQIVVSFGADPARELTWTWRTSPEVERSVVRLRSPGGETRELAGESKLVTIPDLLNDPTIRRHEARATGLSPGTRYEYSIIGEDSWHEIRTPQSGPSSVSLLYMGDPQCGLEGWGKLLAEARRRRPEAAALLIAGDLVDRGNERTNWDHFFLRAAGVFESLPVMPAVGNHEYLDRGPYLYRSTFALPGNGPPGIDANLVYSFEIGDAFVAVLDSTLAVFSPQQARVQAEWLEDCLVRSPRTWKIVMFHHAVHASHPTREYPGLRDAWTPVFDRQGVDLVLQGHDHAYQRTYPLRAGQPAEGGAVYVVSVSGDKFCEQRSSSTTEIGFTHVSTYQTLDITNGELIYGSHDVSGVERDRLVLRKPAVLRQAAHSSRQVSRER